MFDTYQKKKNNNNNAYIVCFPYSTYKKPWCFITLIVALRQQTNIWFGGGGVTRFMMDILSETTKLPKNKIFFFQPK